MFNTKEKYIQCTIGKPIDGLVWTFIRMILSRRLVPFSMERRLILRREGLSMADGSNNLLPHYCFD